MSNELTKQECELLIEALTAWEYDVGDDSFGAIMAGLLSTDAPPEIKRKMDMDIKERRDKMKKERKRRQERAIMLKAKLLTIKDSEVAKEIM